MNVMHTAECQLLLMANYGSPLNSGLLLLWQIRLGI